MFSALAASLIPVTVALDWTPNTNHLGLYVAKANGSFAKHNLDVRFVQMKQTSTTQLVGAGKADFGISFVSDMLHARLQKIPVMSVAGILPENTSCFAWRGTTSIATIKDFEGKRYGGWGSPEEEAKLRFIMTQAGADFKKLKMVTTGVSDFLPTTARNADFMWIYMGWDGIRAKLENVAIKTLCLRDINPVFNHPSPLIITSEQLAKDKPEMVRKCLAAASEGYQFAVNKPAEAAQFFMKQVPESDSKLIAASAAYLAREYTKNVSQWGYQDVSRFNAYRIWANQQKIHNLSEDAAQFVSNVFLPKAPAASGKSK